MSVEVIIPWRDGSDARHRALSWVCDRWRETFPSWDLTVSAAPSGDWVKAAAVMPAVVASAADVIVVADADVWCDGVAEAVSAVADGGWWAVPHFLVHRLGQRATQAVYGGLSPRDAAVLHGVDQAPYVGVEAGGLVVLGRELALDVPLDPRFLGWGGEDHAWGYALSSMVGVPWRGRQDLWHLWHPPQNRRTRLIGSSKSEALRRRYRDARSHPSDMRRLVAEAVEANRCLRHSR